MTDAALLEKLATAGGERLRTWMERRPLQLHVLVESVRSAPAPTAREVVEADLQVVAKLAKAIERGGRYAGPAREMLQPLLQLARVHTSDEIDAEARLDAGESGSARRGMGPDAEWMRAYRKGYLAWRRGARYPSDPVERRGWAGAFANESEEARGIVVAAAQAALAQTPKGKRGYTQSAETAITPDGRNYVRYPLPGDMHGYTKGTEIGKILRVDGVNRDKAIVTVSAVLPNGTVEYTGEVPRMRLEDSVVNGMEVVRLAPGRVEENALDYEIELADERNRHSFQNESYAMLAAALRVVRAGGPMHAAKAAALEQFRTEFDSSDARHAPVRMTAAQQRDEAERVWDGNVRHMVDKVLRTIAARSTVEPPKVQIGDITDIVSLTHDNIRYTWKWGTMLNGGRPYLDAAFDTVEQRSAHPTKNQRAAALKLASKLRDAEYDKPKAPKAPVTGYRYFTLARPYTGRPAGGRVESHSMLARVATGKGGLASYNDVVVFAEKPDDGEIYAAQMMPIAADGGPMYPSLNKWAEAVDGAG